MVGRSGWCCRKMDRQVFRMNNTDNFGIAKGNFSAMGSLFRKVILEPTMNISPTWCGQAPLGWLRFCVPGVVFIRGLKSLDQRVTGTSAMGLCFVMGMMITSLSLEVLTLKYTNSFNGMMIATLCASVLWKHPTEI